MNIVKQKIPGLYLIEPYVHNDPRGSFVKYFNEDVFRDHGILDCGFREQFYSISGKNVIRGMHFQIPPHSHCKLVCLVRGRAIDVILDLRKGSPSFGEFASFEFDRPIAVYVPEGCAHGFLSLEDDTIMTYCTGTVHNPGFDCGLRYDSFGFDWKVVNPEISERDLVSPIFNDFESPFVFK